MTLGFIKVALFKNVLKKNMISIYLINYLVLKNNKGDIFEILAMSVEAYPPIDNPRRFCELSL